jgi:nitronate monooxygenase
MTIGSAMWKQRPAGSVQWMTSAIAKTYEPRPERPVAPTDTEEPQRCHDRRQSALEMTTVMGARSRGAHTLVALLQLSTEHPVIIQGGMGIGVSGWPLARAVSLTGQLGVVSGTALAHVLVRRLQADEPDPALARAMDWFPFPEVVARVRSRYQRPRRAGQRRFSAIAMYTLEPSVHLTELTVLANFVEVALAKRGHDGLVGINLLEKVALPNLPSLYGAMLAGVDYVLMGAGVPRAIPAVLDQLAEHQPTSLAIPVLGGGEETIRFDPRELGAGVPSPPPRPPALRRPHFLAIVSSDVLATMLARKASGRVDGFVVEGSVAGGHNAPPRETAAADATGEPVYGARDLPNLERLRALGLPFWLAGSYATPERLAEARQLGAQGVQVGTAFALCRESGISEGLKVSMLRLSARGEASVRTDPRASPTGMPFKVVALPGTLSDPEVYAGRTRRCDIGYLRRPCRTADGGVEYRCPAEPERTFEAKGGDPGDATKRMCLCNGLLATIGLGQRRASGYEEPPVVTAGHDLRTVARFSAGDGASYTAADVVARLLGGLVAEGQDPATVARASD